MPNIINEKDAFEYFIKFRSFTRAYRIYISDHPYTVNPNTNKIITDKAFYRSVWKYILENEGEGRPVIRDILGERGIILTDSMWKSYMVNLVKVVFWGGARKRFLETRGLENFVPEKTRYI